MSSGRFTPPPVGAPSSIAFPPVSRRVLDNGLRVWCMREPSAPVVSISILVDAGTGRDPADRPGLSSLVAALATEGAGTRDSLAFADAVARLGARLDAAPGTDVSAVSISTLADNMQPALELLADVVRRPRFGATDFERVRELRRSRLQQASRVAATVADRALIEAVYGDHAYGHGSLGTTVAVDATSLDEIRALWEATWTPQGATLLIVGDVEPPAVADAASSVFDDWRGPDAPVAIVPPIHQPKGALYVVDRPGSPHAEIRVGHVGPPRRIADFHELQALNALLGGQFTSRINRNLRETRAITYGARTAFELRRAGGLFSCDTSVDAAHTATAITEILLELRAVQADEAVTAAELDSAQASLTRGYVRHFETAAQLTRALADLATHSLPDDTFDRFVPGILSVTPSAVVRSARAHLHPEEASVVVVADLSQQLASLTALGLPVVETTVAF